MMAIGLYAGGESTKLRTGLFITLMALLLSDAVMSFYAGMWYVYAASLILCFFMFSNFLVWASGHMYPHTTAGLAACFAAHLPSWQNRALGDAFYTPHSWEAT